jgi:NADPH:quinone reductase-like Zn-dependent oxidoreductase
MKAIVQDVYGGPEVLELREVSRPVVTDDDVLVRVRSAGVNPADWHIMRGTPYIARLAFGLRKKKDEVLGIDFAGTVESAGRNVKQFQPGDEVFGSGSGAFAEYVSIPVARALALKPAEVSFEAAAAVPIAAITALQALRDQANVQPGQEVLINGASGGVGTFAVQIAKSYGAKVTGVCSGKNMEMVLGIGADRVIDYTQEDFTRGEQRYDLMLDIAGNRKWSESQRVLRPAGTFVAVGGPTGNRWIGPLGKSVAVRFGSMRGSRKVVSLFLAKANTEDLMVVQKLLEAGKVTPVIDRTYPLSETPEAIRYLEAGHACGKVVITV